MRITTALILEPCDFTPDMNLRKEAFDAMVKHDIVLSAGVVIKSVAPGDATPAPEPVKRTRKPKTVIVEPVAEQKEPLTSGMATP